jgi:hypothetical protein
MKDERIKESQSQITRSQHMDLTLHLACINHHHSAFCIFIDCQVPPHQTSSRSHAFSIVYRSYILEYSILYHLTITNTFSSWLCVVQFDNLALVKFLCQTLQVCYWNWSWSLVWFHLQVKSQKNSYSDCSPCFDYSSFCYF